MTNIMTTGGEWLACFFAVKLFVHSRKHYNFYLAHTYTEIGLEGAGYYNNCTGYSRTKDQSSKTCQHN